MEPNNGNKPEEGRKSFDGASDFEGLHSEGIDIIGSGIGEENVPLMTFVPQKQKPAAAPQSNRPDLAAAPVTKTPPTPTPAPAPAPRPSEPKPADSSDRAATIASARSVFESARKTESPIQPETKPASAPTLDRTPSSTPVPPFAPPKPPSPPEPQKPFVPPQPAPTTPPKPIEPASAPKNETPEFHRVSFGVSPAMPKDIDTPVQTKAEPVLAEKPEAVKAAEPKINPETAQKPAAGPSLAPKPPITPEPKPIPPTPPTPPRTPIPTPPPAPVSPPSSAPTPAMPKPPSPPEPQKNPLGNSAGLPKVEMPLAQGVKNDPSIKPIRTFKSDAEEAVRFQNVSAIDIAVAEQKKKEAAPTPVEYEEGKRSAAGIYVISALLLVVLIGGGWYYWYSTTSTDQSVPVSTEPTKVQTVVIDTIIPYAKASTIALEEGSDPLVLIAAKLASGNGGLGGVYALMPTLGATSTTLASAESLFSQTQMPARLKRSLGRDYMIGAYTLDTQSPFLIITNTFFQNAFSGMLEWEKDLRNDMLPLIQISHPGETGTNSDTDAFEDTVVSNIDTRILKGATGDVILAYAFADKDTVVISTNTDTLRYVLEKLLTVRTIQ